MKIITEYPFNEYIGYTMINKENRRMIHLVHKQNKKRTTISYPRYLISVKEKRMLNLTEQVDHIDGNKTNDSMDNLQILSKKENIRKSFIQSNRTQKMVRLECPNCRIQFEKAQNQSHLVNKCSFSCCSRDCLHKFLKVLRSKEQMIEIGKNQIIEIFRK